MRNDLYPLNAPGISAPGPEMLAFAKNLGDDSETSGKGSNVVLSVVGKKLKDLFCQLLYEPGFCLPVVNRAGVPTPLRVVSGHLWGHDVTGPVPADVFVLGKMLGEDEAKQGRNLVGPTGKLLLETCRKLGIKPASWYVSNLMKTAHPDAASGSRDLKAAWVKEWMPLVQQELCIVRPKYILCLGADAAKALLGKTATVSRMQGRVVDYTYRVNRKADEPEKWHTARTMVIVHPAAVLNEPREQERFEGGLARFGELIRGGEWDKEEEDLDHRVIDNLRDLQKLYFEIRRDCPDKLLGVDAEWQGDHPQNKGAYLRTIQLSWAHKTAATIVLRKAGGKIGFKGGTLKDAKHWINKICSDKQITGSFFVSDMEWFQYFGYDAIVRAFFAVPDSWQEYMRRFMAHEGPMGFDIAYAMHSVEETASFDLNAMTLRYTAAPRYDVKLDRWKLEYCKVRKIKLKDLEGYGDCPSEILVGVEQPLPADWGKRAGRPVKESYAGYDADVSRRICKRLTKLLCVDSFGNNCWESFWSKMRAVPAILEMNTTGLPVDKERMDLLTEDYIGARNRLEEQIRVWANWDTLNLASVQQVRELLFGEKYNGKKKANPDDPPIRIRPKKGEPCGYCKGSGKVHREQCPVCDGTTKCRHTARSLRLTPVLTTDKRQMRWEDVLEQGLEKEKSPSTGKLALAILAEDAMAVRRTRKDGSAYEEDLSDQVRLVRDHRFIGQVLKYTLRPPKWNTEDDAYEEDSDGNLVYDKGLPKSICSDGRVRTYLIPTKETSRWASIRPSMQNFCYDEETEFLTMRGWIFGRDLRSDDRVAQYWAETKAIDFVSPSCFVRQPYVGPMVSLQGDLCDLLVTPNHRCLIERKNTGKLAEFSAESFPKSGYQFVAGYRRGRNWEVPPWQLILLAATQADGHWNRGHLEFCFKKIRKWTRLRTALDVGGVTYTCCNSSRGDLRLRISNRSELGTCHWLKDMLQRGKVFKFDMLSLCHERSLEFLANEVLFWDGSQTFGNRYYMSTVKQNRDFVHALFTLTGRRATVNDEVGRVYCHVNQSDKIDISCLKRKEQHYRKKVYCVTVPSGWIVVRRHGKTAISGNSKRREKDFRRILGDQYRWPLRTIITAPPGYCLVESDYKGAELFFMAVTSGDEVMFDHVMRNQLPEDDPNYYDIHSTVACLAFNLDCSPTKQGLSSIGKKYLRDVAKTVVFGIAYGRGAKAIALAAREEGTKITAAEAQQIIDAVFDLYPKLRPFFDGCKERVSGRPIYGDNQDRWEQGERWLCGVGGDYRRFPFTDDRRLLGDMEREAANFYIQNGVAAIVNRAVDHLYHYREEQPAIRYCLALQVHDAILSLVPNECVARYCDEVVPECMSQRVPLYPCGFDGMPQGTGPYYLGTDTTVYSHWNQVLMPDECKERGISPKRAGWYRKDDGWAHNDFDKKLWRKGKLVSLAS